MWYPLPNSLEGSPTACDSGAFYHVLIVILAELHELIYQFSSTLAVLAVFQPQQVQGCAVFLRFLKDLLIVRHLVGGLGCCGREQYFSDLLVRYFDRYGYASTQASARRSTPATVFREQTIHTGGYFDVVETQASQLQDFAVIGHSDDVLVVFTLSRACNKQPLYRLFPKMLNRRGRTVQLVRLQGTPYAVEMHGWRAGIQYNAVW